MRRWFSIKAIAVGLMPVDLLLRVIGPNYRLFFWLFLVMPPGLVAWVFRLRAIRAADYAYRKVPAYRQFLHSKGVFEVAIDSLSVAPTDKANYISPFPPDQRCVNGKIPLCGTTTDESSGSTGTPYNTIGSDRLRNATRAISSSAISPGIALATNLGSRSMPFQWAPGLPASTWASLSKETAW